MNMESYRLNQLLSMSPRAQLERTRRKIREAYHHWEGDVYVAFSGGRDSTVLLDLVREQFPKVPAVFCDTGLEYPEVRKFALSVDNLVTLKPKITFKEILSKYGYPVISKETAQKLYEIRTTKSDKLRHKRMHGDDNKNKSGKLSEKWKFLIDCPFKISHMCCDVMKKRPSKSFEKKEGVFPFVGTMVCDSQLRKQSYRKHTCNAFDLTRPRSAPLSLWSEDHIRLYVKDRGLKISDIYNMGENHTGCMFCAFSIHLEKSPNKFQRMKKIHPRLWAYCMDKLGMREVLKYINIPCE